MISVTHDDGRPLFTYRSQDGDLVLVVSDPDIHIVVPSADELLRHTSQVVRKLHIRCDVVHPETGEVLAEADDVFVLPNPVAEHILAVAKAHPHVYYVYTDEDGQTLIAPYCP